MKRIDEDVEYTILNGVQKPEGRKEGRPSLGRKRSAKMPTDSPIWIFAYSR
jgi:hypothetical protein